jgi:hypothetical protein
MQIKEIKLQRGRGEGNAISLNIKGNLAGEENLLQIEELFKKLCRAGIGIAKMTLGAQEAVKRSSFPSPSQWLELKQAVIHKIGTADGDEIDNYVREQVGVNRIDLLTAREVQELINKLSV